MGKVIATNLFSRTWSDPAGNANGAVVGDETLIVVDGALRFNGTEGITENSSQRINQAVVKTRQDPITLWARVRFDALANTSIGLFLRWQDANNYVLCGLREITTSNMHLIERIGGTSYTRAGYDGVYVDNTTYWLRADLKEQTVRYRLYSDVAGAPGSVLDTGLSDLSYASLALPLTGVCGLSLVSDTSFNAPQMVHIKLEAGDYE